MDNNGDHDSTNKQNPALAGRIDRNAGTVHINGLKITDHDTDFNVGDVDGSNIGAAPTPVIAVAPSFECNASGGANGSYSGAGTTDPNGDAIAAYFWQINGQPAGESVAATGFFPLGSSSLSLLAFDTSLASGVAQTPVQVVDTTPPTFPALADQIVTLCDPMADSTTVTIPAPTDICDPNLTVTGQVISSNGATLGTPRPVAGGTVQMGTGTNVVQWTATDHSGNSTSVVQTFRVRPAIYANGEDVHIGPNGVVRVNDTVMAAIGNSGTDEIFVDPQAHVGDLLSVGKVILGFKSRVDGDILTASTILQDSTAVVTGTQTQHGVVSLAPPLGLDGVTFPTQFSGQVLALHNTTTINPGTYDTVIVGPGATLHMNPGTYFVRFMQIQLGSRLEIDETSGGTRLFVNSHLDYAGNVVTVAGNALDFVLGYNRDDLVILNSPFTGTFVGPQATVAVQTLSVQTHPTFTGRLFARGITLDHDGTITCVSPSTAGSDGVLVETNPAVAGGGGHTLSLRMGNESPASSGPPSMSDGGCSVRKAERSRMGALSAIPLVAALSALVGWRGARRRRGKRQM